MKEIADTDFLPILEPQATILTAINAISCILGTFGNVALISIIIFHKQLRGASEMLLVSLGLADLLSCAVYIPLLILRLNTAHKLTTMMNQSRRAIGQATAVSASLSLFMLTADQFIFFYRPFRYLSWMRKKCVLTAIIGIYIVAASCGVVAYFEMLRSQYFKTGIIATALMAFFCLHFAIFRLASGQRNKVTNQQLSLQHNYHVAGTVMQRAKRNLRTVMLFGVLYVITWLPVTVFQIWYSFADHEDDHNLEIFQMYFYLLLTIQQISYVVDPFLYCYRNNKIRAVLLKMLPCQKKQVQVSATNMSVGQTVSTTASKGHPASPKHSSTKPPEQPGIQSRNANINHAAE